MSQTQYNHLMSNLLNERHALAKLRAELEERRGKLCRCCKKFGYLVSRIELWRTEEQSYK